MPDTLNAAYNRTKFLNERKAMKPPTGRLSEQAEGRGNDDADSWQRGIIFKEKNKNHDRNRFRRFVV